MAKKSPSLTADAAAERLEQTSVPAERDVSLARLASGLAHEMKNPLAAVVMGAKLLRRGLDGLPEEQRVLLDAILRESGRLNAILEEFVKFAKPSAPRPSEQDLRLLLEESLQLIEEELRSAELLQRYEIRRDLRSLPAVPVDRDQMQYVLMQLLRGACEAMPGGGRLTVASRREGDEAVLSIGDEGPGLGPEALAAALQPYGLEQRDGGGLRLPICLRIVEAHGGRLSVESGGEAGTSLQVRLPLSTAPRRSGGV